jgi:hypothetical protein
MGLCLEADDKPPAVKRWARNYCLRQASTKAVIDAAQYGAFASPGSSLGLQQCRRFSSDYDQSGLAV